MICYSKFLKNMKEFRKLSEIDELARRYFAINMFDEVLTIIGILVASVFAGVNEPKIVISACIGAAVAMAISGVWGAYLTEKAEREGKMKLLEKKLSINLKKTHIGRAHKLAAIFLGLVDGLLPLIATPFIIFPFFLNVQMMFAYQLSLIISFIGLFLTGSFLGKISKENLIYAGIRMIFVGAVCVLIIFLIEMLI